MAIFATANRSQFPTRTLVLERRRREKKVCGCENAIHVTRCRIQRNSFFIQTTVAPSRRTWCRFAWWVVNHFNADDILLTYVWNEPTATPGIHHVTPASIFIIFIFQMNFCSGVSGVAKCACQVIRLSVSRQIYYYSTSPKRPEDNATTWLVSTAALQPAVIVVAAVNTSVAASDIETERLFA